MENAAVKIAMNDLSHIGPRKLILPGKPFVIDLLKRFKMIFNTLIILGRLRVARLVDRREIGYRPSFPNQDEELPDSFYCKLTWKSRGTAKIQS